MLKLVLVTIIFVIIVIVLINSIIKNILNFIEYKRNPPRSTGMYWDAELGSLNGDIDNRPKFKCEECENRFKTENELIAHQRLHKIDKLKETLNKNKKKPFTIFGKRFF